MSRTRHRRGVIAWLEGEALSADVVRTVSGVGYQVHCPQPLEVGAEVALWVTTVVRDDAILLYGFADRVDQSCFADLVKAPKVGPQIALNLLRDLGVAGLVAALDAEDVATLRTVAGVGPTLAKSLAANVKLSPEVLDAAAANPTRESPGGFDPMVDALRITLVGLGFNDTVALNAVRAARAELPDADEGDVLSRALELTREAA